MTTVGLALLVVGAGIAALLYTGNAPEAVAALPLSFEAWIVVAIAGAVLMYFNRRPGN